MVSFARSSWLRLAVALATISSAVAEECLTRKRFELTITWDKWAPDGVERDMVLVNGKFPAPTLEIDQGDHVEVLIHNKMPYNTTVHFHGMANPAAAWHGMAGGTE